MKEKSVVIYLADDDEDDRLIFAEALSEVKFPTITLLTAEDGNKLITALTGRHTLPDLVFLDLNMPKKDGREALKEIKADPRLKNIRVVILTTSKAEEDIYRTYDLSAASYITKPVTFASMAEVVKVLGKYWLEIVALPAEENGGDGGGNG